MGNSSNKYEKANTDEKVSISSKNSLKEYDPETGTWNIYNCQKKCKKRKLVYHGEMEGDKKVGKGTFYIYKHGNIEPVQTISGTFNDCTITDGTLFHLKKEYVIYQGDFKKANQRYVFHGKGKLFYNADQVKYEGILKYGKISEGTKYYKNGKVMFTGEFTKSLQRYKKGTLRENGTVFKGQFKNGKPWYGIKKTKHGKIIRIDGGCVAYDIDYSISEEFSD